MKVSVVKMATVLEEMYYRREAFLLCVFCGQKVSMQSIFIKKYVLFTMGSVCNVKRFTTESIISLKGVRKSQMKPDQVRRWLRQ
jgi:hypothetical protein